jgi:hypothetical protein
LTTTRSVPHRHSLSMCVAGPLAEAGGTTIGARSAATLWNSGLTTGSAQVVAWGQSIVAVLGCFCWEGLQAKMSGSDLHT